MFSRHWLNQDKPHTWIKENGEMKAFSFRKGSQALGEGAVLGNQQLGSLHQTPPDNKCSDSEKKNNSNFSIGLLSIGQKLKHTMILKLFN